LAAAAFNAADNFALDSGDQTRASLGLRSSPFRIPSTWRFCASKLVISDFSSAIRALMGATWASRLALKVLLADSTATLFIVALSVFDSSPLN
jgi:hypothetical protein